MTRICEWFRDGRRCRRRAQIVVDAYEVCRQCRDADPFLSQLPAREIDR